ncbi:MAG: VTT domain-containing protein [Rubritalea sp.]|uniref:TVP38/TMEM64 family protein n=1 Tax=Rubritalea sp. TaxID=2109375 RepID=UPI00324296E5
MKPLIKTALGLIGIFLLIFILLNSTGLLTQDDLAEMLRNAENWPKLWIGLLVIGLLTSDIIIPVPGIVVVSIGGYFLGSIWGAVCGSLGLTLAGVTGYTLCRVYGYRMLKRIYRDETHLANMKETFHQHSILVLLLSRSLPMFPEAASCLAGATHMPFWKFLLTFGASCTIYSIAVAYAGSLSSAEDLTPALIAYLCIMAVLWSSWALFIRNNKRSKKSV